VNITWCIRPASSSCILAAQGGHSRLEQHYGNIANSCFKAAIRSARG
jgi:hypothetical protein